MNEEVLQRLYESASAHFDMPDYAQFKVDMLDKDTALRFRNSMSEYYDIPDDETFLSDLGLADLKKKDGTDLESSEGSLDGQKPEEDDIEIKDYGSIVAEAVRPFSPTAALAVDAAEALGVDVDNAVETGIAQGYTTKEVGAMILNDKVETLEDARKLVKGMEQYEKVGPSKAMKEYQKSAQDLEKDGYSEFSSAILALADSPQVVPEVILTSMVAMGPAIAENPKDMIVSTATGAVAGAAGGFASGGVPGAISGALGGAGFGFRFGTNFVLDSALSSMGFLKEELGEKEMTPENVLEVLQDEEKYDRIVSRSVARGETIGVVEGILGRFASGLSKTGKISGISGAVATEVAGGGLGEAAAQVRADQKISAQDIVLESIGGFIGVGGVVSEGLAARKLESRYSINGEEVSKEKAQKIVDNLSQEELKDLNIGVENDDAFVEEVKNKRDAEIDESQVDQKTDKKGRTFTYYSSTTEKDGVKTTRFTFNRSDKSESQRNQAFVEPEAAFGNEFEANPESIPEGTTVISVSEIREGESGAVATVLFENNDGSGTFLGEVELFKKQEETPAIPTEDVQGPMEEIKYTLPTDPREARKDFSIIDNRDGSTTDLLEDGSNRWIVVNDKTNRLVETRTKKDAELLARNPEGNWDYGEGDVIGERQAPTKMFVAPFYDTKIDTQEDALSVRSTEGYMKAMDALKNNASAFNLKYGEDYNVTESIGGFINKKGDKIREVSNVIEFKEGTPFEQIEKLAAVLGANTFETQEATIAAEYIDPESDVYQTDEAILEYTLSLGADNTQAILDTLKELEIYDFTLNETNGDLTLLDFGKGTDASFTEMVDSIGDKLKEKGLTYGTEQVTKRAVRSSYIDPTKRKKIITDIRRSSLLEGQTGTELFKAIEQAVDRDADFNQQTRDEYLGEVSEEEATSQEQQAEEITEDQVEEEQSDVEPTLRQRFFERYKSFGDALRGLKTKLKLDPKRGNVVIRNLQEQAKGEVSAEGYIALNTLKQIKKLAGDSSEARAVADKVLRGEKLTTDEAQKHIKIVAKAQEARASIDRLSQSLIDLNILPKESAENIAKNIGTYLTRSYEAFENPNYVPTTRSRRKAKDFLLKNPELIQSLAQKESDETGVSFQEALSNQADKYLDNLITPQNGDTFLSREFRLNRGILKRKKDVPKALREFLGEVESGEEGYYITHLKMANLLNTARYQKAILENGLGKFIFEANDPNKPKNPVTIKGSAYSILDGYVASQDVVDAVIPKQDKVIDAWYKPILELNGLIKGGLTVYNPGSYLRNYISTMVMLGVRGDLNSLSGFIQAHRDYKKFWLNQADVNKNIVEYKKAGIIGQNIEAGAVESALNDRLKDPESGLDSALKGQGKRNKTIRHYIRKFYKVPYLGKGTKGVADFMQSTFQAGDDVGKIIAYEARKKFYADALFDKSVDELSDSQLDEVTNKASNEIKDQYNNYDRVPPAIKALSRQPAIGSFVQFPAEMIRNSVNVYLSAIDNINSGNPKLKADGIKRIATFTTAQTALVVGSTILGEKILSSLDLGSEKDEQEVKDLRNVVAPWSKNNRINVVSKGKNKLSYMDISANNPYAFVSKMIQQGIDKDNAFSVAVGAVEEFFGPFVQQEVLFKAATEAYNGKTESGRVIWYKHNNFIEKGAAMAMHIVEAGMPGYVKTIQRFIDKDKSIANELRSLTGFRTTDVKLDTSIYFKMRDVYETTQSLQSEYRAKAREGDDQYEEYNERYQDALQKAHEIYMSHIRLGLDSETAFDQLRKSMGKNQKFRKSERIAIVYGDLPSMRAYDPK